MFDPNELDAKIAKSYINAEKFKEAKGLVIRILEKKQKIS